MTGTESSADAPGEERQFRNLLRSGRIRMETIPNLEHTLFERTGQRMGGGAGPRLRDGRPGRSRPGRPSGATPERAPAAARSFEYL